MSEGEPIVCSMLRGGMSYSELYEAHAVKAKPHNGKVSLVYDQIAAKETDAVACQCRGLVLREGTFDVLAYPFERFFNHTQGCAAELDWGSARYEEKLDGTLLIAYRDGARWRVATRSMCEAHGDINGAGTFSELADRAAQAQGAADFDDLMARAHVPESATYMLELTSPYNQIVCRYEALGLHLLGARSHLDWREFDPSMAAEQIGIPTPKTWRFDNLAHMVEVLRDWHPLEHEGIVAKDNAFRRVKVKCPQYLAAAHIAESCSASWRGCVELLLAGNADDLLPNLPILAQERLGKVRPMLAELVAEVERDAAELAPIDDIKTYALAAQKRRWSSPLFAIKRGKAADVRTFMRDVRPDTIVQLLGLKEMAA